MTSGPLSGVKVLDFTQVVAGPFGTMQLADLGADVVKVEPPGGDIIRTVTPSPVPFEGKNFHALNRGKRSVVVNLKERRGREVIYRLMRGFDVAVVNFRPGVAKQLGIDYDTLSSIRPDLVYMEATAYGTRGPAATRPGGDVTVQGYSGLMALGGKVDPFGAPEAIPGAPMDHATGFVLAMGVCAALYHRAMTGEGQYLSTSMLSTALSVQGANVARSPLFDATGRDQVLERVRGARARDASYAELLEARGSRIHGPIWLYFKGYSAKDGGFILGANTAANRDEIRPVLGISDDPTAAPDFDTLDPAEQEARVAAMHERIRAIMQTRTVDEWEQAFNAANAPGSRVNLAEEIADDPQVQALGIMLHSEHELCGPEQLVGSVLEMSKTATGPRIPSPTLGGHTEQVLLDAGFGAHEIAELRDAGIVR